MTGSSPFSAEPNISPILPDSRDAYQRQLVWMRTAAEIASLALTAQSLDELLQQTVSLITQRFAYYQTSIFMLDESGQYASVRAVAGNSAEQTQARDLRVVVGSRSVIGWVAAHNQPRIVGDVTQEFFYQKDELLSETRSEAAFPLSRRVVKDGPEGESSPQTLAIMGALDVQHNQENAFDEDAITVLQTIANQIAAAIQNYRLLETTQRNLEEVSELYRASRDMARANKVEDIRDALYRVLRVARYSALLLVIQPGATNAEDQLIPYQPDAEKAGTMHSSFASGLPADLPMVNLLGVEASLRQSGKDLETKDASGSVNTAGESTASESTASESTAGENTAGESGLPFVDCQVIDLGKGDAATAAPALPGDLGAFARHLGFVSAAFIPVAQLGRLVMLFVLGSAQENLTADSMQTFVGLADLCKTALERVYTMQIMEKRLTSLQTLSAISQAVSVQTDLNELYAVIHNEVRKLMGEVSFFIAIYELTENLIQVPYLFEMGAQQPRQLPAFALGEGMTSIVINTRQPLMLVEDTERRSLEMGAKLVGAPAKSWLGVPLLVAGEVTGAIVIQDLYQERRFDEDDLRLMVTLAAQVAVTVRNARLLEKTHHQAERERILNEITSQIRASSDAQTILQTTTREVARMLGARRARLVLSPEEEQQFDIEDGL